MKRILYYQRFGSKEWIGFFTTECSVGNSRHNFRHTTMMVALLLNSNFLTNRVLAISTTCLSWECNLCKYFPQNSSQMQTDHLAYVVTASWPAAEHFMLLECLRTCLTHENRLNSRDKNWTKFCNHEDN